MIFELAIIMLTLIVIAVEPAERLLLRYRNWKDRQEAHQRSLNE
jgi:hypothetical protein